MYSQFTIHARVIEFYVNCTDAVLLHITILLFIKRPNGHIIFSFYFSTGIITLQQRLFGMLRSTLKWCYTHHGIINELHGYTYK